MNNLRTIATLREHLFKQLDLLSDPTATVDMERARMIAELSQTVINSAKVEVEFAKVIKGATTVPFFENQPDSEERPYSPPLQAPAKVEPADTPTTPASAQDKDQAVLSAGPGPNHPWRGLGARVHRIRG